MLCISSAGQKEGVLNSKDRLYNDIVDYLTESKLDFTKSVAETQEAYFVQELSDLFSYFYSGKLMVGGLQRSACEPAQRVTDQHFC